jgi:hypothetical protein
LIRLSKRVSKLLILATVICLTFVLAWKGYKEYFAENNVQVDAVELFFCSINMFRAEYFFDPGPKPYTLVISQILAPCVTLYTLFIASLVLLRGKMRRVFISRHAIICGLNEYTPLLIEKLNRDNTRTLVINESEDALLEPACLRLGAAVIHGAANSTENLRMARIQKATTFIASLGDDAKNIEAAFAAFSAISQSAPNGGTFHCYINLENSEWCTSFQGFRELTQSVERFEPVVFNSFQNIARVAFHRNPLDRVHICPNDPRQVHLILIGFERLASAIAVQFAHTCHFANNKKPKMTVIDRAIAEKRDQFLCKYPQFEKVVDVEFMEGSPGTPEIRAQLAKTVNDTSDIVTVAVCKNRITDCFVEAFGLPPEYRDKDIPILIQLSEQSADTDFSRFTSQGDRCVIPFAFKEDAIDLDFKIDELAQGFHAMYLERAGLEGQNPESNPAMRQWPKLDYLYKVSNRRLADHIDVKLRAIGCKTVSLDCASEARILQFSDEEIEIMARMEHQRWAAERYMDGWRLGPTDKPRRISSYLVPFDDLEPSIQEYDREPIRQLPGMLEKHCQLAIVREQETEGGEK